MSFAQGQPNHAGAGCGCLAAVGIVDGPDGRVLLAHLRAMTQQFSSGLASLGLETLRGEHPVVPLKFRDTHRTLRIIGHLRDEGILATGLNYPVVPKGNAEIRFQIPADHTAADMEEALAVLRRLPR